jgi:pimeloyl-ACP methyl ester carboxylesterase
MMTFLLVHGAWHGGWCWKKVEPLLRKTGSKVLTPTLSGLGDRSHLAQQLDPSNIDLDLHIRDIVQVIEYEDLEQVVLVGHAYAGMVITGVAEVCPERLSHLVYLNGVVPANGESMVSQLAAVRGAEFAAWVAGVIERGEKFLPAPTKTEIRTRWGITDPEDLDWMSSHVTSQPVAAMASPVRISNPEAAAVPRSFVRGAEAGFQAVADRVEGAGWAVYHVDSGHDTMVTHPRDLAEILLGIGSSF